MPDWSEETFGRQPYRRSLFPSEEPMMICEASPGSVCSSVKSLISPQTKGVEGVGRVSPIWRYRRGSVVEMASESISLYIGSVFVSDCKGSSRSEREPAILVLIFITAAQGGATVGAAKEEF